MDSHCSQNLPLIMSSRIRIIFEASHMRHTNEKYLQMEIDLCTLCRENLFNGEHLRVVICGHVFHELCFAELVSR